ncbi:MAG: hypothetical protein IJL10_04645, partial [Synergistaceae bacterium]|nr:hypothetical protein [Synergistaceae bacterium]
MKARQEELEASKNADEKEKEKIRKEREEVEKATLKLAKKIVGQKEKHRQEVEKEENKKERAKEKYERKLQKDSIKMAEMEEAERIRQEQEDAEDNMLDLTSKQKKMMKKIQEQKMLMADQAERDSLLMLDGDFDMVTGERDSTDLPPDVMERLRKKNQKPVVDFDSEGFPLEDEDMYEETPNFDGDSTDYNYNENDSIHIEGVDTVIHLTSKIDSNLLVQQIAELEQELQNIRDINELEKSGKG